MGNTPNYNIYYLSNGDPQSQITESSTQAGTIEAALDNVAGSVQSVNNFGVRFFVNASARDLALLNPEVGWITQLGSELFMRRWDGVAWVPYGAGLFPIIPSSVSGNNVSMTADGVVEWFSNGGGGTINDATSVCVDGVFTSEFRGYKLQFSADTSTNTTSLFWLRDGGLTLEGGTDYSRAYSHVTGATYAGNSTTDSSGLISSTGTSSFGGELEVLNPSLTASTTVLSRFGGVTDTGAGRTGYGSSVYTPTTQVDGIRLRPSVAATTWTGSLRIFGVL